MKHEQMSDTEKKTYDWLSREAKPVAKRHWCLILIVSTVVVAIIASETHRLWVSPTVAHATAISIGAQFLGVYGALLLALQAWSNPVTLGLMSMTRWDGNPRLFAELMKSRISARVGIWFIFVGFLTHGVSVLVMETIMSTSTFP